MVIHVENNRIEVFFVISAPKASSRINVYPDISKQTVLCYEKTRGIVQTSNAMQCFHSAAHIHM